MFYVLWVQGVRYMYYPVSRLNDGRVAPFLKVFHKSIFTAFVLFLFVQIRRFVKRQFSDVFKYMSHVIPPNQFGKEPMKGIP